MLTAISVILLMSFIIAFHELGHLFAARLAGVKVEKYSIGFGKKIFSFTDKKGTIWQLAPILLGGYVSLYGSSKKDLEDKDAVDKDKMFLTQPTYKKIFILVAGSFANLILGFLSLFSLYFITGITTYEPVVAKSSIEIIKQADKIVKIDNIKVTSEYDIKNYLRNINKSVVAIELIRNNKNMIVNTPLKSKGYNKIFKKYSYELPFEYDKKVTIKQRLGFYDSIAMVFGKVVKVVKGYFNVFYLMFTGEIGNVFSGPVKIFAITGKAINSGIEQTLFMAFLLNITLFIFNLFPIPVLDGGYVVLFIVESIIGREIPEKLMKVALYSGLVLLIFMQFLGIYNDFKEYYPKVKNKIAYISLR